MQLLFQQISIPVHMATFSVFFSGGKVKNTLLFSYHMSISTTKSCATISFAVLLISFHSTRYHTDSLHSTFMTLCSLDLVSRNSNYSRLINTLGTLKKKTKIMASSPITSWQIDGETVERCQTLFWGAPKSLQMVTAAMKLKDACPFEEKL